MKDHYLLISKILQKCDDLLFQKIFCIAICVVFSPKSGPELVLKKIVWESTGLKKKAWMLRKERLRECFVYIIIFVALWRAFLSLDYVVERAYFSIHGTEKAAIWSPRKTDSFFLHFRFIFAGTNILIWLIRI